MKYFDKARWVKVVEPQIKPKGERPAYWVGKTFTAQAGPQVIRLSAQGLYQAYLNGKRIGNDELTPGSTQYRARIQFQTYEVELEAGENRIEILVADGWFRGAAEIMRDDRQWGDHVAVIAEISGLVASDSTWHSSPSHIISADLFLGQNEDRNLFEIREWTPVEEIEVAAALVEPIAPAVKRIRELKPKSIRKLEDGAFIVDFGQNINGWTRLNNLGSAGNKTTIIHGEFIGPDGNLNTKHLDVDFPMMPEVIYDHQIDSVISAGIENDSFEPKFTTHGFQFVRVEGFEGELQEKDITAILVHTDLERIGTFTSSDRRLTWLHDATVWSFVDNACDIPTDCPTRERAGWTGDWQIFVDTAAFLFDVDAFSRKWLADAVIDQGADGKLTNISPAVQPITMNNFTNSLSGSAGWGDVIVQAPLAAYRAYGKTEALEECFEAMQKWIGFGLHAAETGRHAGRTGDVLPHEKYLWDTGFHWGEWLEPGEQTNPMQHTSMDMSEIASAYLYRSTRDFAEVCRILAKPETLAEKYTDLASQIRAAWQIEFLDANGLVKTQKQAAMARALEFGLVDEDKRAAVAGQLASLIKSNGNRLGTGFLATVYLLPMLAENGQAETAFDVLFQEQEPSWLYMRNKGATTVWEVWDGISEDSSTASASLNHYSKGSVISFLHHNVVGLKAKRPGYQEFVVQPTLDDRVPDAAVTLESPFGRIAAGWRREGDAVVVEVTAPALASGQIVLPDGRTISVPSGQTVTATC